MLQTMWHLLRTNPYLIRSEHSNNMMYTLHTSHLCDRHPLAIPGTYCMCTESNGSISRIAEEHGKSVVIQKTEYEYVT